MMNLTNQKPYSNLKFFITNLNQCKAITEDRKKKFADEDFMKDLLADLKRYNQNNVDSREKFKITDAAIKVLIDEVDITKMCGRHDNTDDAPSIDGKEKNKSQIRSLIDALLLKSGVLSSKERCLNLFNLSVDAKLRGKGKIASLIAKYLIKEIKPLFENQEVNSSELSNVSNFLKLLKSRNFVQSSNFVFYDLVYEVFENYQKKRCAQGKDKNGRPVYYEIERLQALLPSVESNEYGMRTEYFIPQRIETPFEKPIVSKDKGKEKEKEKEMERYEEYFPQRVKFPFGEGRFEPYPIEESVQEEFSCSIQFVNEEQDNLLPIDNFYFAVETNNCEKILKLDQLFPGLINRKNEHGLTPLMLACKNNSIEVAFLLLNLGANATEIDSEGNSALIHLMRCQIPLDTKEEHCAHYYLFDRLVSLNEDQLLATDSFEGSALYWAILTRKEDCARRLAEKMNWENLTFLLEYIKLCIQFKVNSLEEVLLKKIDEERLFDVACKTKDPFIICLLVKNDFIYHYRDNIEKVSIFNDALKYWKDKSERTPFLIACANHDLEVALKLLELGADCRSRDVDGSTSLMLLMKNQIPIRDEAKKRDKFLQNFEVLFNEFMKIDNVFCRDNRGKNALDWAIITGKEHYAVKLIERINRYTKLDDFKQGLETACSFNLVNLVRYMLSKNLFSIDRCGYKFFEVALENRHFDVIRELIFAGFGKSKVVRAIKERGDEELKKYLIDNQILNSNLLEVKSVHVNQGNLPTSHTGGFSLDFPRQLQPHVTENFFSSTNSLSSQNTHLQNQTLLHDAAEKNNVTKIRELTQVFPEMIRQLNHEGKTPFLVACESNSFDAALELLTLGEDPEFVDPNGCSGLIHLMKNPTILINDEDERKRDYLVNYIFRLEKIDLFITDNQDRNALDWAIVTKKEKYARRLIDKMNKNRQNTRLKAIRLCFENNLDHLLRTLLQKIKLNNIDNVKILYQIAWDFKNPYIICHLVKNGVDIRKLVDETFPYKYSKKEIDDERFATTLDQFRDRKRSNRTPLSVACTCKNFKVMERLLDAGVNPNSKDTEERTALILLMKNKIPPVAQKRKVKHEKRLDKIFERLIRSESVFFRDKSKKTALDWAIYKGKEDFAIRLIDLFDNNCYQMFHFEQALHIACQKGSIRLVQYMLDKKKSISGECVNKLYEIAHENRNHEMKLLLEKACLLSSINTSNDDINNIIDKFSKNSDFEKLKYLIDRKVVSPELKINNIPLIHCILAKCLQNQNEDKLEGLYEFAEEIARQITDVNIGDDEGYTPLHAAIWAGHTSLVKLLLERGANIEQRGGSGQLTPLEFANVFGNQDIGDILKNMSRI